MALARTDLLGAISPTSGGNFGTGTYTSGSFTPPGSSLLFACVGFAENGGGTNPAADFVITDSGGHTWTPLFQLNTPSGFATAMAVFYTTVTTGAAMTISCTCNSRNISWWAPAIFAYTGYDTVTPIGATASQISATSGAATPTPWAITLSAAPAATSEVIGFLVADRDTAGATQGATFTEIYDLSNPTATVGGGAETEARTGSTSTTVDWQAIRPAGGNLFNFVVVGFEVRAATASDVVIPDPTNGGTGTGGQADGLSLGGGSSGAGTGGTADGVSLGGDSGGAGSSGQLDGLAVGDGSTGTGTGGTADGRALGDGSGGTGTGGSPDTIAGPVVIVDTSGGSGTGGSPDTVVVGSQVVHDVMVMPILLEARTCLVAEVGKLQYPPSRVQIRPGASFEFQADANVNECCEGIAWVRRGTLVPSRNWPNQLADADKEAPSSYAVQLELGIMRCVPIAADFDGSIVTEAQWLQAAQNAEDDAAALRRAICCLRQRYGNDSVIENPILPLENGGMCGGQVVTLLVRAQACDCVE